MSYAFVEVITLVLAVMINCFVREPNLSDNEAKSRHSSRLEIRIDEEVNEP
jgi:MFS family permease